MERLESVESQKDLGILEPGASGDSANSRFWRCRKVWTLWEGAWKYKKSKDTPGTLESLDKVHKQTRHNRHAVAAISGVRNNAS